LARSLAEARAELEVAEGRETQRRAARAAERAEHAEQLLQERRREAALLITAACRRWSMQTDLLRKQGARPQGSRPSCEDVLGDESLDAEVAQIVMTAGLGAAQWGNLRSSSATLSCSSCSSYQLQLVAGGLRSSPTPAIGMPGCEGVHGVPGPAPWCDEAALQPSTGVGSGGSIGSIAWSLSASEGIAAPVAPQTSAPEPARPFSRTGRNPAALEAFPVPAEGSSTATKTHGSEPQRDPSEESPRRSRGRPPALRPDERFTAAGNGLGGTRQTAVGAQSNPDTAACIVADQAAGSGISGARVASSADAAGGAALPVLDGRCCDAVDSQAGPASSTPDASHSVGGPLIADGGGNAQAEDPQITSGFRRTESPSGMARTVGFDLEVESIVERDAADSFARQMCFDTAGMLSPISFTTETVASMGGISRPHSLADAELEDETAAFDYCESLHSQSAEEAEELARILCQERLLSPELFSVDSRSASPLSSHVPARRGNRLGAGQGTSAFAQTFDSLGTASAPESPSGAKRVTIKPQSLDTNRASTMDPEPASNLPSPTATERATPRGHLVSWLFDGALSPDVRSMAVTSPGSEVRGRSLSPAAGAGTVDISSREDLEGAAESKPQAAAELQQPGPKLDPGNISGTERKTPVPPEVLTLPVSRPTYPGRVSPGHQLGSLRDSVESLPDGISEDQDETEGIWVRLWGDVTEGCATPNIFDGGSEPSSPLPRIREEKYEAAFGDCFVESLCSALPGVNSPEMLSVKSVNTFVQLRDRTPDAEVCSLTAKTAAALPKDWGEEDEQALERVMQELARWPSSASFGRLSPRLPVTLASTPAEMAALLGIGRNSPAARRRRPRSAGAGCRCKTPDPEQGKMQALSRCRPASVANMCALQPQVRSPTGRLTGLHAVLGQMAARDAEGCLLPGSHQPSPTAQDPRLLHMSLADCSPHR